MLKMVDGTGIIGVDMVCPLGGTVSPPQPPNYDNVEMEGVGSLMLPNSLKAPLERVELLGNSVQGENPAPDNPQEIKSAGRKSKNLFNIADLRVGQVQKDGTINEKQIYYRTVILDVPQDGKYRITFNSNDDYTMLYFTEAYANGAYSQPYLRVRAGSPNYYITLAKGKNILSFSTHTASGKIVFTTDHNIMIAAESETLDYEPYGYLLDVKVTGKNLFDESNVKKGYITVNDTIQNATELRDEVYSDYIPVVYKSVLMTLQANIPQSEQLWSAIAFYTDDKTFIKRVAYNGLTGKSELKTKVEMMENARFIRVTYRRYGNGKMMINSGETYLPYEPYTEQTLTLTSDRPITKWDKLVKQGGEYGWLYQSAVDTDVKPSRLDLFPNGFSLFKDFGDGVYVYKVTNIKKAIGFQTSLCEQFKNKDGSYSTGDLFCYSDQPSMQMQYFVTDIPTLEEFKTWMEANPLTMVYKTTQAEFIPLPESVQQQLQALHTENGITHVFVDSGEVPCGIKLTYRKEK